MKLLTELEDRMNSHGKRPVYNAGGIRPERAFAQDVMAAHAYKQAIADWHEKNGTDADADVYPETTVAFIEKRAAEILAGWLGEERG